MQRNTVHVATLTWYRYFSIKLNGPPSYFIIFVGQEQKRVEKPSVSGLLAWLLYFVILFMFPDHRHIDGFFSLLQVEAGNSSKFHWCPGDGELHSGQSSHILISLFLSSCLEKAVEVLLIGRIQTRLKVFPSFPVEFCFRLHYFAACLIKQR